MKTHRKPLKKHTKTSHFSGQTPPSPSPLKASRGVTARNGARVGPGARRGVALRLGTHGALPEDLAGEQPRLAGKDLRWIDKNII